MIKCWMYYIIGALLLFHPHLAQKIGMLMDNLSHPEYEVSHIRDALLVGYDDFDISLIDSVSFDKKIVVYCSVGYRSSKIAADLSDIRCLSFRSHS